MPRKSGNTNPGKEHDVGGQSLTCGMCPWSQQAKKKGMFGTQSWALGQCGRLEEGNSLFYPTKQLRFL